MFEASLMRRSGSSGAFSHLAVVVALLAVGPQASAEGNDAVVHIAEGDVWSFFRGTEAPPEAWNQPAFDDSGWEEGPTGIGYGDEDDRTVLEDMRCQLAEGEGEERECVEGGYLSYFVRTTFERPEIPEGQRLFAVVSFDDGFALYANGEEVGRVNLPDGEVGFDTPASTIVGDAPREPDAVIVIPVELLREGANVLAASVHNHNRTSSDASFILSLLVGHPDEGPPPSCEDLCERSANERFQVCISERGEDAEEECAAIRREHFQNCVQRECEDDPDPEPTCEDLCEERANALFHECRENGGDEESCATRRRVALESCLVDECDHDPEEPNCEARCELEANEAFHDCVEERGEDAEEECAARRREQIQGCIRERCDDEPPPDPDCEGTCETRAANAFHACIDEHGEAAEEECRAHSNRMFEACIRDCDGTIPMPPECADDCAHRGERVFQDCLDAGGDEEECRALASDVVGVCLERCGGANPCEDRCSGAAQIVFTGCRLAGLPESQCRELANLVLEACVGGCGDPATCVEQCAELSLRAVAECRERGGDAVECERHGVEVARECSSYCDSGPQPPPCDERCESRADEIAARCRAEGLSESQCAETRATFLEECLVEMGEICDREQQAAQSIFQAFTRGDVDGDGTVTMSDSIGLLGFLFLGTEGSACEDSSDANDDGELNVGDPVTILNYLFLGSARLPAPYPIAGQDPTSDHLICAP